MYNNARARKARLVDDSLKADNHHWMVWPTKSSTRIIHCMFKMLQEMLQETKSSSPRTLRKLKFSLLGEWVLLTWTLIIHLNYNEGAALWNFQICVAKPHSLVIRSIWIYDASFFNCFIYYFPFASSYLLFNFSHNMRHLYTRFYWIKRIIYWVILEFVFIFFNLHVKIAEYENDKHLGIG